MSHVVLGLPVHLQEKINPNDVPTIDDLVSTIIQFDKPFVQKLSESKSSAHLPASASSVPFSSSAFSSLRSRAPCPYCRSKGFERFHKESDCFTKFKDQRNKINVFRSTHNVKPPAIHNLDLSSLEEAIISESKNV